MTFNTQFPAQKKSVDWSTVILGIGFIFVIVVAALLVGSALLMWSWGLFMVPIFGLPLLSLSEAFGALVLLALIASPFKSSFSYKKSNK